MKEEEVIIDVQIRGALSDLKNSYQMLEYLNDPKLPYDGIDDLIKFHKFRINNILTALKKDLKK